MHSSCVGEVSMSKANPAGATTRLEPDTDEDYARCNSCGRESINGEQDILHREDCSERDH